MDEPFLESLSVCEFSIKVPFANRQSASSQSFLYLISAGRIVNKILFFDGRWADRSACPFPAGQHFDRMLH